MSTLQFYLDDVWTNVKRSIKDSNHFDEPIYKTYFEESRLASLNDTKAIILVPTYLQKIILLEEMPIISDTLNSVLDKDNIACVIFLER